MMTCINQSLRPMNINRSICSQQKCGDFNLYMYFHVINQRITFAHGIIWSEVEI